MLKMPNFKWEIHLYRFECVCETTFLGAVLFPPTLFFWICKCEWCVYIPVYLISLRLSQQCSSLLVHVSQTCICWPPWNSSWQFGADWIMHTRQWNYVKNHSEGQKKIYLKRPQQLDHPSSPVYCLNRHCSALTGTF